MSWQLEIICITFSQRFFLALSLVPSFSFAETSVPLQLKELRKSSDSACTNYTHGAYQSSSHSLECFSTIFQQPTVNVSFGHVLVKENAGFTVSDDALLCAKKKMTGNLSTLSFAPLVITVLLPLNYMIIKFQQFTTLTNRQKKKLSEKIFILIRDSIVSHCRQSRDFRIFLRSNRHAALLQCSPFHLDSTSIDMWTVEER